MPQEIERKFLVSGDYKTEVQKAFRITQGYLSSVSERTVRVRVKGDKGFITIKGKGNETGASRYEWEMEIPKTDALELLKICEPGIIDKTRSLVPIGNHSFEVDEFHGENEGLVIAEIELSDEQEEFLKPAWLGEEVTGNEKYYNSMLSRDPYKNWGNLV